MILNFKQHKPKIHKSVFVAPTAAVIGRVTIGPAASVWFGAVLRGDINRIQIGTRTNIQDNCVLHVEDRLPCILKDNVVMGHQATAHACTVENNVLIGIGARILNGARIGKYSIIGAGAVVLEGTRIPPYSLVVGCPGRVIRKLKPKDVKTHRQWAFKYARLGAWYHKHLKANSQIPSGITFLDDLTDIF